MTFCGGKTAWDWYREVGSEAQPVRSRLTRTRACEDCLQSQLMIALDMPFPSIAQRHGGGSSDHDRLTMARWLMLIAVRRQQQDERRTLAQLALHPEPTAVRRNNMACNGQP